MKCSFLHCLDPFVRARGASIVALALCGVLGCAPISVTQEQSYRVISDNTHRDNYGPWTVDVSASVSDGQVALLANTTRECDVHTDRLGEQTTTTRRENQAPAGTILLSLIGVAGASALVWGLDQHFDKGKPLTKTGDDGKDTLSGRGYAVYLGGIGSLGLISMVDAAIRSWDTSTTEETHVTSNERSVCERKAITGARLQVLAGERVLAEQTTDGEGKARLSCLYEQLELLVDHAEVRLDGRHLERQPLQANYGFAELVASSPPRDLARTANAVGVQYAGFETRQLQLYNSALLRARRQDVTDAVRRAGVRSVDESAHVSIFDVTSRAWPHSRTLKLLFDGRGLFVKAKWEGDFTGQHQTELLKALTDRYGLPLRSETADGSVLLRWPFEDGLEVHYERSARPGAAACPTGELSYVDPVHYKEFEAAVNNAAL